MRLLSRPLLLLVGLIAAGLAWRLMPRDGAALARLSAIAIRGGGGGGTFLLASALAVAIGMPRQTVAFAAGLGFGVWRGLALALAAQMLGCLADFLWARTLAGPGLRRRIAAGHWRRLADHLAASPFRATLMLRLLPVGNNLVLNLAAGFAGLAAFPFLAASLIGYVPQSVVFVLLGSGIAIGARARIALGFGLFAASFLLGLALLRATPGPATSGGVDTP